MQTIAVDMDEVITDTVAKLKAWYFRDYGKYYHDDELLGRELRHAIPAEHLPAYQGYLNTPGFFRDLEPMEGSVEVLRRLNDRYELYLVSAAMEFPYSLKDKLDWALERLPFLTWKQVCLCGSKHIVQTDIMLDDRPRNFTRFQGRKILYSATHNAGETRYERVDNWAQVAEKLL